MIDYGDQLKIFDPEAFAWPVHLVGLGGIGSAVLLPLMKLGIKDLVLWDSDEVEPHNIPAQLIYRPDDIGMSKAKAAMDFVERQGSTCEVTIHEEHVTSTSELSGVVIAGVDSMASRMGIWQAVKFNPLVPFFMDGRIGGEQFQLLSLNPSDFDAQAEYEQWLFPDEEAAELPCAARTVIHPPTTLAGLMVAQLTLFIRKESYRSNIMSDLKTMQFSTT